MFFFFFYGFTFVYIIFLFLFFKFIWISIFLEGETRALWVGVAAFFYNVELFSKAKTQKKKTISAQIILTGGDVKGE